MSRLYDVRVNQKRWKAIEVYGEGYHNYRVIDNENNHMYFFSSIIGFEQVDEDEFLVYRRFDADQFQILRVGCRNNEMKVFFSKTFSKFEFVDEDKILFQDYNNRGSYLCGGIYSINENKLLEEANWLKHSPIEVVKDEDGNAFLCVEKEIISTEIGDKKVIFSVDPRTMKPTGCCYSEIRDEYLEANSKEDIDKIVKEDEERKEECVKKIFEEKRIKLNTARKMVLSRKQKV